MNVVCSCVCCSHDMATVVANRLAEHEMKHLKIYWHLPTCNDNSFCSYVHWFEVQLNQSLTYSSLSCSVFPPFNSFVVQKKVFYYQRNQLDTAKVPQSNIGNCVIPCWRLQTATISFFCRTHLWCNWILGLSSQSRCLMSSILDLRLWTAEGITSWLVAKRVSLHSGIFRRTRRYPDYVIFVLTAA